MTELFRFSTAVKRDLNIEEWLSDNPDELYSIARRWFSKMRECGDDVRELIHDGCPVACVEDAAFAYVNVFKAHVNVGFFQGASFEDTNGLMEGAGKRMRHVKVKPDQEIDVNGLESLVEEAYAVVKAKLREELI